MYNYSSYCNKIWKKKKVKKIIRRQLRIREFGKMQDAFALAISRLFMSKG